MDYMIGGVTVTPFLALVTLAGVTSGVAILITLIWRRDRTRHPKSTR